MHCKPEEYLACRQALFRKAVDLLVKGLTKEEFLDFQELLDTDSYDDFLFLYITDAAEKLAPELFHG